VLTRPARDAGSMASTSSGVRPDRLRSSTATRPRVSALSLSPDSCTRPLLSRRASIQACRSTMSVSMQFPSPDPPVRTCHVRQPLYNKHTKRLQTQAFTNAAVHLCCAAHDTVGIGLGLSGHRLQLLAVLDQQLQAVLRAGHSRELGDDLVEPRAGRLCLRRRTLYHLQIDRIK
jgi:hypothetical protein